MTITISPGLQKQLECEGKLKKTGVTQFSIPTTRPSKPKRTKFRKKKKVVTRPKEKPEVLSNQQLKTKVAKLEQFSCEQLDAIVREASTPKSRSFDITLSSSGRELLRQQEVIHRRGLLQRDELDSVFSVCKKMFCVEIECDLGYTQTIPKISKQDLFSLCDAVFDASTYRNRKLGLSRIRKLGLRCRYVG